MPYPRKTFKRSMKRKTYRKRKTIARRVNRLARIANADRHWYDRVFAATPIDSQPVLFSTLNSITTGDSNNNRQGTQVKPSFIHIKGTLALHPNQLITVARVLLVRDWGAPGGVAPNPNLILDGTYFGTLNAPNAPRYVNQLKRFRVIFDKTYPMSVASNTTIRHFEIKRRLKGEIQYFSNNGTDWDRGTLYLIIMDDNTSATNYNNVSFVSRLTYYP